MIRTSTRLRGLAAGSWRVTGNGTYDRGATHVTCLERLVKCSRLHITLG
jgi:hypothetical protein